MKNLIIILTFLLTPSISNASEVISVTNAEDNGEGSLRFAIEIAEDGDSITFTEFFEIFLLSPIDIYNKKISINGEIDPVTVKLFDGSQRDKGKIEYRAKTIDICGYNYKTMGNEQAFILSQGANVSFYNMRFKECEGERGSAILANESTSANIYNCTFYANNSAKSIVDCTNYKVNITNSIFINNETSSQSIVTYCNLYNCIFKNNKGYEGGAAYQCKIYGSTFEANTANNGGAAFNCEIRNSTLIANTANNGGAAYNCEIYDSILKANTAHKSGGAAYDCKIYNSELEANSAHMAGAAFKGYLEKCFIVKNKASLSDEATCEAEAVNSIYYGNTTIDSKNREQFN